jgi:hypothetical protein
MVGSDVLAWHGSQKPSQAKQNRPSQGQAMSLAYLGLWPWLEIFKAIDHGLSHFRKKAVTFSSAFEGFESSKVTQSCTKSTKVDKSPQKCQSSVAFSKLCLPLKSRSLDIVSHAKSK